jgi:hypothetical protein
MKKKQPRAANCFRAHGTGFSLARFAAARRQSLDDQWEGVVEVFDITGHPHTKRCYAWSFPEGTETRFVTVLEIPPVESAQTAVRASIAGEQRKPQ